MKKTNSTFSVGYRALFALVPLVTFYLGVLPALYVAFVVWQFFPFNDVFYVFILPFVILIIFLLFVISEILIAATVIIVFHLKYHEGEYDGSSNNINFIKMSLYYPLYRFPYQILDFLGVHSLKIVFLRLLGLTFGKNSTLGSIGVFLMDPCLTEIGENTYIGAYSMLTAHAIERDKVIIKKIKIGHNCLIGAETTILPGATIEDNVIVGARSLILKNQTLKKGLTYAGTPAKEVSPWS